MSEKATSAKKLYFQKEKDWWRITITEVAQVIYFSNKFIFDDEREASLGIKER